MLDESGKSGCKDDSASLSVHGADLHYGWRILQGAWSSLQDDFNREKESGLRAS